MTFVFDVVRRTVHWSGRKLYKVESGTISFDEIIGVGTEMGPGSDDGGEGYRLALITTKGSIPMAYAYGGNSPRYESQRKTIPAFVRPDHSNTACLEVTSPNGAIAENDLSIRSLLIQRRKIDAITLVKTREDLDLTQAVQRVNDVEKKMKFES
jgi:hypothetical protein